MDPYKGGLKQEIISFFFKIILYIALLFLKIVYKNAKDDIIEPAHLIPPPEKPIPSLKLAFALNPETPPAKLTGLTEEEDSFIRRAVCRKPSLPQNQLEKLVNDEDPSVSDEAKLALKNRLDFNPKGYKLPAI